jgi:hypothetical protein
MTLTNKIELNKTYNEDAIQVRIEKYFSTIKRAYKTKYWERKNYK